MYKYEDPSVDIKERVIDLISHMTVEEKIGQMMQISRSSITEQEAEEWVTKRFAGSFLYAFSDNARQLQNWSKTTRLRIPLLFGIDAIHGHALNPAATVFPSQLAMSCSWDEELVREIGAVTARETAAEGLHWTFSPVLCIGRDTRWGRIDETFGEDPYLIGVLASAIIKGYQGEKLSDKDSILACAKHYLGYGESTGGRDAYDTSASIRKVKEVFLPPFKMAVEAGCATVMAGYESVDGVPVSANRKLLRDILKDEVGFNGFVVTDWDNTGRMITEQKICSDIEGAAYKAITAGNDMIMNTNAFYDAAVKLVKVGKIPESMIDEAVKRILYIKFLLGLFDSKREFRDDTAAVLNCDEHKKVNMKAAMESIVLLKNENRTLPLKKDIKKIAVVGPNADDLWAQFGDWTFFSHPEPHEDVPPKAPYYTVLGGIKEMCSDRGIEVLYSRGCDVMDKTNEDIDKAVKAAAEADVVIAVVGDCVNQHGEMKDRANLDLSGAQQELLEKLKETGKPLIVVLVNSKPLTIGWTAENADAIVESFNSGAFGGKAVAQVLFGEQNPCGKLTISFPYHTGQIPVYYNQLPGWHSQKYVDIPSEPLYSFGYGLSYTQYKYSNLRLSKCICSLDDTITASVDVTNTGDMDGAEIVQLYVNDKESSVVTPIKQLKGFKRVNIKAGETQNVDIQLKISELYIVNTDEQYVVEPGEFAVMAGSSSRQQDLLSTKLIVE